MLTSMVSSILFLRYGRTGFNLPYLVDIYLGGIYILAKFIRLDPRGLAAIQRIRRKFFFRVEGPPRDGVLSGM